MKNRDFFEIIKNLNHEELRVYTSLDKLSINTGYVYAGYKYLSAKLDISEEKINKIVSDLIKRKYLFYLKSEDKFKIFTDIFKFYRELKNIKNEIKKENSVRVTAPLTEEKNTIEDEELEKAVEEAYNNLNEVELFEIYDEAEEKYKRDLNAPYGDNQKRYFELLKEVYMKLILKERIKNERIN
ncbi:helix-turn-helix domain-containing protein [Fusobacterium ulcerans]|uniref:helix-turn-helix domain-containing protein n=1 Tax=Fusobacterium ulcerans TaxID=861 RepID=UPI001D0A4C7A|nr:helix-turn-helix domain-containing protein [Fusobacterium ulcerans]MCB8564473.1 helix-turn-helix domain-containing protein [Fusobacterium ulcerans]MCB8648644.1 helix-turn-helix domain-containing protein [Fusobacterium ulcerans]